MNVLCLGARIIGDELAVELAQAFLRANFTQEDRHVRRLEKVLQIERDALEWNILSLNDLSSILMHGLRIRDAPGNWECNRSHRPLCFEIRNELRRRSTARHADSRHLSTRAVRAVNRSLPAEDCRRR